jgi:hypothetical protein
MALVYSAVLRTHPNIAFPISSQPRQRRGSVAVAGSVQHNFPFFDLTEAN